MYEFLLFIHVLAAVIWVGGGITVNILGDRLVKETNPDALAGFVRQTAFVGSRVYAPVSALLFIAGVFMVLDRWDFQDLWIAIGVVGFLYSFITGAAILGPLSGKTGKLIEEQGADDPKVVSNIKKLFMFGRVEAVVMIIVIAAMTVKPTL
ncbi:MAG: DUF2269 family protein [Actinomycetota bacterium]